MFINRFNMCLHDNNKFWFQNDLMIKTLSTSSYKNVLRMPTYYNLWNIDLQKVVNIYI